MALGGCLLFDGRSERALRELWGRLERQGHVAAAAYEVLPLTVRVTRAALIDSALGTLWPLDTLP